MDFLNNLFSTLFSVNILPFWERLILIIKIISFIFSSLLAIGIIITAIKVASLPHLKIKVREALNVLPPSPVSRGGDEKEFSDDWLRISKRAESGLETDMALAVIEADNLIDEVLKNAGYEGETLASRLKQIDRGKLKSIDDLWEAHKIRNQLVHTPNFKITPSEAGLILGNFKKALEELGAI